MTTDTIDLIAEQLKQRVAALTADLNRANAALTALTNGNGNGHHPTVREVAQAAGLAVDRRAKPGKWVEYVVRRRHGQTPTVANRDLRMNPATVAKLESAV